MDVTITATETCTLAGTTSAKCTALLKATASTSKTSSTVVETLTGATYYRFDVAITGGAEKTASPTACATKKGAAASVSPKKTVVWALVGVFGIAGLQALL